MEAINNNEIINHNCDIVRGSIKVENFPFYLKGEVIRGFGRGSKQLGIPTANIPTKEYASILSTFPCGVYYGWAKVNFKKQTDDQKNCSQVFKMAMNIGWVPFYKNKDKSIEIHILNNFGFDFYGEELRAIALGYIREEMDFKGIDTLIAAIADDVEYSKKQLENPTHKKYETDPFFD